MDWSKLSRQVAALVLVFALVVGSAGLPLIATSSAQSAAAATVGDMIFSGNEAGEVIARDASDGSTLWTAPITSNSVNRVEVGVNGDYVYAGTGGGSGNLKKLDASDGSVVWSYNSGTYQIAGIGIDPSGDTVYAADNSGSLVAIDTTDGSELWTKDVDGESAVAVGVSLDGESVYVGGTGSDDINAVYTSNQTIAWTYGLGKNPEGVAVGGNGDIYTTYSSNVDAINPDGSTKWTRSLTLSAKKIAPGPDGNYVYAADTNYLFKLDAVDGSKIWSESVSSNTLAGVGVNSENTQVYVGSKDGDDTTYARDTSDGSSLWYNEGSGYVNSISGGGTASINTASTVSGTVTDSDGTAIDGANVTVEQSGSVVTTTTTDSSGAYSIDLQDGDYTIAANDAEYQAVSKTVTVSGSARTVDYQLPDYTISGTVTDTAGDPIANATVAIGSGSTDYATTNAEGEYSIIVDGGSYEKIAAAKSGFAMNSTTVDVDGDKTVNLTLSPQSNPATGTVETGYQSNAQGAKVDVLDPVTGEIVYTTLVDGNGEYSLNQTGEYTVRANRADTEEDTVRTTVEAGGFVPMLYIRSESGTTDITTRDTTDPITGGDLDTLNLTSISECNALVESRYGEAAVYLTFGGIPAAADALGVFKFGPDSCEVDTAKQERLALLAGSAVTNQSEQNTQTVANNYLTDARQVAYAEGKLAAVEALKDGAVAEQAKHEANQSVDQYYQSIYVNTGSGYSTGVQQAKYVYEREYEQTGSTGSWVYPVDANGNALQFAANPWEEVTVEHPDGDTTIWTYRLSSGELVTPFPNKTTAPGGGPYITGPSLRVVGPDDTSDTRSGGAYTSIADSQTFGTIVSEVDSQRTQVKDNLAVTVDGTLAEIDPANITTTDFLSPSEIASRASTDHESTGYYGFAAAQLAATGYQGNLNTSHTIERASGERVEGTLFYTGNDLDQFQNGTRYDPTAYDGTFLFATNGDGIQELTAPFEIVRQTNTNTGEATENATLQSYVYNTTTTDGLSEDLSLLSQVAEEYDDASAASGGFGLPEGTNTRVIVGLLVLVGLLLATRD